jgi:serine/threonine-protein kinase HipA
MQPKLLIRDETALSESVGPADRTSIYGATHIVKFWEAEYPELATNEYFCLAAARKCGLDVPKVRLSDDGRALVVDRFDLCADGHYLGFEDFCVLNAKRTADKYRGSYETAILKRFREIASPDRVGRGSEQIFKMIALNAALRNGDAHLKNFGVIYDRIDGTVSLAPTYDLVTTTAYLPADMMALTLGGSTRWPTKAQLLAFATNRQIVGVNAAEQMLAQIAEAMDETMAEMRQHMQMHPEFREIGERMVTIWGDGIKTSLGT